MQARVEGWHASSDLQTGWAQQGHSRFIADIRAIAPTLPDLRRRHPELRINLKSLPDRALLERGDADIAMGTKKPHSDAAIVHEVHELEYDVYRSARLEIGPGDQWTYIAAGRDVAVASREFARLDADIEAAACCV